MNTEKQYWHWVRRQCSGIGWGLVLFMIMLNLVTVAAILPHLVHIFFLESIDGVEATASEIQSIIGSDATGYFAGIFTALVILISGYGLRHWRQEIWQNRRPMQVKAFFTILVVFLSFQMVSTFVTTVLDTLLQTVDVDMISGFEEMMEMQGDSFSMFLYAGVLAPVWEEILFRGYIQSKLRHFGRTFAIVWTAFLFGMFHGNLIQAPFAFLTGLVLGYVAEEYSLAWCMVLHMINNLVVADLIPRLTAYLPETADYAIQNGILWLCLIGGIVLVIRNRRAILGYVRESPMSRAHVRRFFLNSGIFVFLVMCVSEMLLMLQ